MISPAAAAIADGRAVLGIELGSTRIKACLIGPDHAVLATGSHSWENEIVAGHWSYSLEAVRGGLAGAYADLVVTAHEAHGVAPASLAAVGVSAMMHGYLAFDADGELLVPFRTWRDTSTGEAAAALTEALNFNVPLRWSVAHLYQAVLDSEEHVSHVAHVTTLAGYVHEMLGGERVLGVGDASGMFPIDPATGTYDAARLAAADALLTARGFGTPLTQVLPGVLSAGEIAGTLSAAGAAVLDPTGTLQGGALLAPPEGDAGTGMVATNAVARRTGNVSVGTSIFAMVVLEQELGNLHEEIDVVTTPTGDLVAMVHCNNGASELGAWAGVFHRFATLLGSEPSADDVFAALLTEALDGEGDGGGVLAYNQLSGEPVLGLRHGRPAVIRTPASTLNLANLSRSMVYGVFAALSVGMRVLHAEGVAVDVLQAHGGLFRTAGVAQRFLAAAMDAPVGVSDSASEGGAWGMAVLAAFAHRVAGLPDDAAPTLAGFLDGEVFAHAAAAVVQPNPEDVAGYAAYLTQYELGLAAERAASEALPRGNA